MPSLFYTYFVVLASVIAIDALYLYFVAGPLFEAQVLAVQRTALQVDRWAALLCYLAIAALLVYVGFLDRHKYPATEAEAFFVGFATYAVFELTCKAIFVNWTWTTVAVDSLWGGSLFALSLLLAKRLLLRTGFGSGGGASK